MKTLILMRHAKSSWDDPELADFDRPLNARGNAAAPFMGRLMAERGLLPEIVIASPAARAIATARLAVAASGRDISIVTDERIYEASTHRLAIAISKVSDKYSAVMLVGHNPGMEGIVQFISGRSEQMPTAAVAVIELRIEGWDEIDDRCGKLKNVFRPRDEMARSK